MLKEESIENETFFTQTVATGETKATFGGVYSPNLTTKGIRLSPNLPTSGFSRVLSAIQR